MDAEHSVPDEFQNKSKVPCPPKEGIACCLFPNQTNMVPNNFIYWLKFETEKKGLNYWNYTPSRKAFTRLMSKTWIQDVNVRHILFTNGTNPWNQE